MRRDPVVEWECKLCAEVFFVPYKVVTVHTNDDKATMEVKPDLADLFAHMWMHEAKGER